jgi:2-hydroxychromene-2-carboxylate isomerase
MATLEFFFDCSSPWTYLAFSRIEGLAAKTASEIQWKPILVGGVFNAVNSEIYELRANPNPVKAVYSDKDLQDWARYCGVKINWPRVFPVRAVDCMRGALVAQDAAVLPAYARALFEAYWEQGRDISQHEELARICAAVGLDADTFFAGLVDEKVKERLRNNTEELIKRGGFGSPTIFINGGDMYFGNDRLPLVEAALNS